MSDKKPLFRDLNAEDPDPEITQVESLCMNCHANGITKILLTKIPFYKEVVLMSFSCGECGYANNEIQPGGQTAEKGIRITLTAKTSADLNRQVVKSDHASVKIVELEFEIPSKSQKGEVTTVEGILQRAIAALQQDQHSRRLESAEIADQLDEFIKKLQMCQDLTTPFTLIVEDITGNSFIENPNAPHSDPQCSVQYFKRRKEQDHEIGIFTKEEIEETKEDTGLLQPCAEEDFTLEDLEGEVLQFPTNCTNCSSPCETNMKITNIPHFKEVVIMSTTCDACGHRTNEVKSGAGIEPKGVRLEVQVVNKEDLCRDILKSETCELSIPELELEVGPNALSGRFTTVEGLLMAMKEQLSENMFKDSQDPISKEKFENFLSKFDEIVKNKLSITLVLDDPAGNSYVQSMKDDNTLDDGLKISHYERTFEQNDDLGINDMKTENYETS